MNAWILSITVPLGFFVLGWALGVPKEERLIENRSPDWRPVLPEQQANSEAAMDWIGMLALHWGTWETPSTSEGFRDRMQTLSDLPVLYWDERLSSYAAEQAMLEADMSRKKRARNIDQIAASIILQGCLDRLREVPDGNTR